jgi:hypothetical protein
MTVAAIEAVVLREHLKRGSGVSARRFFREIARYINVPWEISAVWGPGGIPPGPHVV